MLNGHYLGRLGEKTAGDYLRRKGYELLERQWRYGRCEIDIIALRQDIIVFVEVKTRQQNPGGLPDEGLSKKQCERIGKAAMAYLDATAWNGFWQFDLIAIEWKGEGNYLLRHLLDLPLLS